MKSKKSGLTKAEGADKWILPLIAMIFMGLFIISGFDERYGWSNLPVFVEMIGFLILLISFYFIIRSMLDNPYASKVLDIRKDSGHKVVDTGLYSIVRHPMYTGLSLLGFGVALGLGSWYALIPSVLFILILAVRIKFEEEMLIEGLDGYEKYREKVRYKLIPKLY